MLTTGHFLGLRVDSARYPYMVIWTSPETLTASTHIGSSGNPAVALAAVSGGGSAVGAAVGAAVIGDTSRDVPHGPDGAVLIGRMTPDLLAHLTKRCNEPLRRIE